MGGRGFKIAQGSRSVKMLNVPFFPHAVPFIVRILRWVDGYRHIFLLEIGAASGRPNGHIDDGEGARATKQQMNQIDRFMIFIKPVRVDVVCACP